MADAPILITGASGQVGAALVRLAQARSRTAVGLGRRVLDVGDPESVEHAVARIGPAVIINAAAYTDVDGAEDEREGARRVNTAGPAHLARACEQAGIPLIHISTDYVFDGETDRPYREEDPINPINAYGRSKADGEAAVRNHLRRHLIVRTSWVFAAGHQNFVTTIARLAAERDVLEVVDDQLGSPTPAEALADRLLTLVDQAVRGTLTWGTVHVAGEPAVSRFGLAEAIVEHTGASCGLEPVGSEAFPTRARRPRNTALDCARAFASYGLDPIDWREGLARVLKA